MFIVYYSKLYMSYDDIIQLWTMEYLKMYLTSYIVITSSITFLNSAFT